MRNDAEGILRVGVNGTGALLLSELFGYLMCSVFVRHC